MNLMDLAAHALMGFLVSLMIADMLRLSLGFHWPVQQPGLKLELRPLPWLLTLVAGPALLYDAAAGWIRGGQARATDMIAAAFVLVLWSGSYGQCVVTLARYLL